jgi:hypothetical protein
MQKPRASKNVIVFRVLSYSNFQFISESLRPLGKYKRFPMKTVGLNKNQNSFCQNITWASKKNPEFFSQNVPFEIRKIALFCFNI